MGKSGAALEKFLFGGGGRGEVLDLRLPSRVLDSSGAIHRIYGKNKVCGT